MPPSHEPTREALLHQLYEAAELEHNLMCTYLYAAFSLRTGEHEGLSPAQAEAVARWRRDIIAVAVDEMSHLCAVWNITSALGGTPRFGRANFPLDAGMLPAGVVVRLAPFSASVVQHFVHLERPGDSSEPDGTDFVPELSYHRAVHAPRLTPMGIDYGTVGEFYARLADDLRAFVARVGEAGAFCGDRALQLSSTELALRGAQTVICAKTALAAFEAIVQQGEGAPVDARDSHFQRFVAMRDELAQLKAADPHFEPAHPAATNPVLRPPLRPAGRVHIEHEESARTVDVANASYGLMLRLLAYAYAVPGPSAEKRLAVDLSVGLMRAVTPLAERAARLPAGPAAPGLHAGMSFTILRDTAPFPPGPSARRHFLERFDELGAACSELGADARVESAQRVLAQLGERARRGFATADAATVKPSAQAPAVAAAPAPAEASPASQIVDGVEIVEGSKLTILFEGQKCIHARHCVTGAPTVFLANVQGPWIHPDTMDAELLAGIAHACPSGAIRYRRKDGRPDEAAPPVNLLSVREAGPYAARGDLSIDGAPAGFRATLCRCGASKHKPYCDGSHHDAGFTASGEPETSDATAMLSERGGPLEIEPEVDGPLSVRGNLEVVSGTGRLVRRLTSARFCRCGHSGTKPLCDGSHARVGFRS